MRRFPLVLGVSFALTLSVHLVGKHRTASVASDTRDHTAPTLANPGGQADALTSEFGYAAAVLAHSPLSYWRLDDYTGASAHDASIAPHHGTIAAGVSRLQAGALADGSLAMRFGDAIGTRIDIADDSAFALTSAVTVEAWAKVDTLDAAGSILEKVSGTETSYRLAQEAGFWTWRVTGTFGSLNRWVAVSQEDVGTWVHLVGTFDGTTTRLYKNGALAHSHSAVGTLTAGTGTTRIGRLANDGYPFAGALDDIAVYPAALNAGQIASHYALRTSPSWVHLPLAATDPESDPLIYTATNLPPGLRLHPETGVITGNPDVAGTYSVTATVTDPGALSSSETFEWIITSPAAVNPNRPWIFNPGAQSSALTVEQGYAGAVMMASPIGYWRLEDYSGTSVADWSGAGHAGAAAGGMTRAIAGALADGSLAMQFDGEVTTRIDIPDDSAFRLTEAVTVEVWAKTTQGYAIGLLFDKSQGGPTTASYRLMQEGDMWVWRVVGSFGTLNRWTPVTAGDVGSWVHLVGTFDGQTTRLYKNGVLMQSHEAVGTLTTSAGVTRIGLLGYDAYAFPGSIDEVAVYASALTAGQVASHHALRTATSSIVLELDALEPDSEAMTFAATGLPPGLVINPITGIISGNPTTAGTYSVTVTVSDPGGLAIAATFPWTITTPSATNPQRPLLANPGNRSNTIVPGYGYPAGVLSASPIGYWRLDDASGSTATDVGSVPHHGTLHGSITHAQAGALADGRTAMRFAGVTGNRIEIPATSSLEVTNAATVELWAKTDAQTANGGLFDKTIGGATDQAFELLQETDRWSWWLFGTFGMVNVWTPVEAGDVGTWVHLVATFDGSTAKLYKNGQLAGSAAAAGTLAAGEGIALIGHLGSGIFPFGGVIDDVSVYAAALTPSQITSHYERRTLPAAVSLQLAASDPDGDPLTYHATGLPSTFAINPNTGLISGTPTETGTHTVTATVRDAGGLSASQTFTWTFTPPATTVTVTNPFPGTILKAPIDLTLAASVQSDGAIAQVQFVDGETTLGTDTTAPYEFMWSSVPLGAHAVRAVVTGSLGDTTTSAAVAFSVTSSGSGFGTLGAPLATPAPGVHGGPLNVTLTAAPDATIRYTTDGSAPNTSSPIYSGPINVTDLLILEARAFQTGWTTSPSFVGTYRLDTTAPSVTAIVSPPANAGGWNRTDVRIRFVCKDQQGVGVAECPAEVVLDNEGANQVITRTVTDRAGNSTSVSVTVSIDKTAPTLALADPLPRHTETSPLNVAGTVSDSLSGIAKVKCNADAVTPVAGALACAFPLEPGGNLILITAVDAAGNSASVSSRTRLTNGTATSLRLSPHKFSLFIGGKRLLELSNNFEREIEEAEWESSDELVATIDDDVVTAVGSGTATITATVGSLSTSVEVTVYGGTTLPTGAVRWERQPAPGYAIGEVLMGMPDGLRMSRYAVEYHTDSLAPPIVTALDENGELKWTTALPVAPGYSAFVKSNSLGGVIVQAEDSTFTLDADGQPGWSRESPGIILGQGPGGTLFLVDSAAPQPGMADDRWIVVMDGRTGNVRARIPFPQSSWEWQGSCVEWTTAHKQYYSGEIKGGMAIDADDAMHLFLYTDHGISACSPPHNTTIHFGSDLRFWSISRNGGMSERPLVSRFGQIFNGMWPEMGGDQVLPTPDGNVIFTWGGRDPIGPEQYQSYGSVSRLHGGSGTNNGLSQLVMGEDNTIFGTNEEGYVAAVDATSLNTRWTSTVAGNIVTSTAGGGVIVHDGEVLHTIDSTGSVAASTALSASGKPSGTGWIATGGGSSAELEIPRINWSGAGFSMPGGSVLGQNAPMNCTPPPISYRVTSPLRDYRFDFSSQAVFNPYMHTTIESAAAAWKSAGYEQVLKKRTPPQANNVLIRFHTNTARTRAIGATLFPIGDYDLTNEDARRSFTLITPYGPDADLFQISFRSDLFSAYPTNPPPPNLPPVYPFSELLMRYTALHEFGHLIGLDHIDATCAQGDSVMYPTSPQTVDEGLNPAFEWKGLWIPHAVPTTQDKVALQRLYGRQ